MSRKYFRWLGGRLIFDFCNTLVLLNEAEIELLETKEDLEHWFSCIDRDEVEITSTTLETMIELRQTLRTAFQALLDDEEKGIMLLNQVLDAHKTSVRIQYYRQNYRLQYFSDTDPVGIILSEVVRIFENANLERIKNCDREDCSHFFYDTSKANRRKWCEVDACGNKMKGKHHYGRQKEE